MSEPFRLDVFRVTDVNRLLEVVDTLSMIASEHVVDEVRYWIETYHQAIRKLVENKPLTEDESKIVRDVKFTEIKMNSPAIPRAFKEVRQQVGGGGEITPMSLIMMGYPLVLHRYMLHWNDHTLPIYQAFTELHILLTYALGAFSKGGVFEDGKRINEILATLPDSMQLTDILTWKHREGGRYTVRLKDISIGFF